jgi:8-oxo-dGTP pyrophosphatase MutT (NUDIX family)
MPNNRNLPLIIKDVLSARSPQIIDDSQALYRHAAVLIPIFRDNGEYKIIFTKRTNRVEEHKGQISFPGGAVDKEDVSLEATALREAYEEVGLLREDVTVLGRTDDALTLASNYIIHPFVGFIPYPYPFRINTVEVKRILEVPLRLFWVEDHIDKTGPVEYEGVTYESLIYPYQGDVIWGASARIMENLIEILDEKISLPIEKD